MDGDLTRRRWRSLIGRLPPKSLSLALTDRILTWREQVAQGGDISSRSRAILAAALADGNAEGKKNSEIQGYVTWNAPDAHRPHPRAPLRTGTTLVREHAGVLHRVTATPEGFEWEGKGYASLSAVARAITGVCWNGHRFFGSDYVARGSDRRKDRAAAAGARHASRQLEEASRAGDAT